MENIIESNIKIVKLNKMKRRKKIAITLIAIFSVLFLIAAAAASYAYYYTRYTDKIIMGVYFDNINLSMKSPQEAFDLINENYDGSNRQIKLLAENSEYLLSLKDMNYKFDAQKTMNNAWIIGRSNNVFYDVAEFYICQIFSNHIAISYTIDQTKVDTWIYDIADEVKTDKQKSSYTIMDDKLFFFRGKDGEKIDIEATKAAIYKSISYPSDDLSVKAVLITDPADQNIDLNKIKSEIDSEMRNASLVMSEDGSYEITREQTGYNLDISVAENALQNNKSNMIEIPLVVQKPQYTYESLKQGLFSDVLGTYTTTVDVSLVDRTHNLNLAATKVNGTVIMPGNEFSFNKIVGERTLQTGFREAKIFVKDEIVDGVGGGICQVVSTLYTACLKADLNIVERKSHRFTVAYIPLGYDATVAYNSIDYRFTNNTKYPIRINAVLKGNKLTVTILGTQDTPGKEVKLSTKSYDRKPHGEKTKLDPSMKAGTSKVDTKGSDGISVDTFKTVTVNGEVVYSKMIHTSVYSPCDKVILVGPEPAPTQTPVEGDKPNDGQTDQTPTPPDGTQTDTTSGNTTGNTNDTDNTDGTDTTTPGIPGVIPPGG